MPGTRTEIRLETGLRLAYLTSRYPAASSTFIANEIRGLRERGHHLDVFSIRRPTPDELPGELRDAAAEVTYVVPVRPTFLLAAHLAAFWLAPWRYICVLGQALRRPSGRGPWARVRPLLYFGEAAVLARMLCLQRIRHLHVHHANAAALVGLLAARLAGASYSFTAHGSDILLERDRLDEKLIGARFVITVSEFNRRQLVAAAGGTSITPIQVVHTGVDLQTFQPRPLARRSGPPRILAVGRLHPVKGFDHLLAALARLRDARVDFDCDVVGDGPLRVHLAGRIHALGLDRQVHLRGAAPASVLPGYFRQADVFVLSSLSEGLPVVLMEAMASGLPVVATRITGVPELVEDGVTGWLVPAGDPAALARALNECLRDPARGHRLGQAGRRTVERGFDLESNLDRLDRLFREELDDRLKSIEA